MAERDITPRALAPKRLDSGGADKSELVIVSLTTMMNLTLKAKVRIGGTGLLRTRKH